MVPSDQIDAWWAGPAAEEVGDVLFRQPLLGGVRIRVDGCSVGEGDPEGLPVCPERTDSLFTPVLFVRRSGSCDKPRAPNSESLHAPPRLPVEDSERVGAAERDHDLVAVHP